jgi:peroxiredoxin
MKKNYAVLIFALCLGSLGFAAKVGELAPSFSAQGADGSMHALSEFGGKYVVLEWHNKDCPFVKKQYSTHNMQDLQKKWKAKGVVWLSIVSSAKGEQGFEDAKTANADVKATDASPTLTLLDPTGKVGHLYDAKTTPHMFIIGPHGRIIYNGAIDDKPTPDKADVKIAKNYVDTALTEAMAGKDVTTPVTQPYGCSVKY